MLPIVLIVTGRPGSGKTTLARKLVERIHGPLISRDAIKQGIVNTFGSKEAPGGTAGEEAYATFLATVDLLLRNRVSLIIEGYLPPELWQQEIARWRLLARIRLIFCQVESALAHSRVTIRYATDQRWRLLHNPPVDQRGRPQEKYAAPNVDLPILFVDSSEGYTPDLDSIVEFATQ